MDKLNTTQTVDFFAASTIGGAQALASQTQSSMENIQKLLEAQGAAANTMSQQVTQLNQDTSAAADNLLTISRLPPKLANVLGLFDSDWNAAYQQQRIRNNSIKAAEANQQLENARRATELHISLEDSKQRAIKAGLDAATTGLSASLQIQQNQRAQESHQQSLVMGQLNIRTAALQLQRAEWQKTLMGVEQLDTGQLKALAESSNDPRSALAAEIYGNRVQAQNNLTLLPIALEAKNTAAVDQIMIGLSKAFDSEDLKILSEAKASGKDAEIEINGKKYNVPVASVSTALAAYETNRENQLNMALARGDRAGSFQAAGEYMELTRRGLEMFGSMTGADQAPAIKALQSRISNATNQAQQFLNAAEEARKAGDVQKYQDASDLAQKLIVGMRGEIDKEIDNIVKGAPPETQKILKGILTTGTVDNESLVPALVNYGMADPMLTQELFSGKFAHMIAQTNKLITDTVTQRLDRLNPGASLQAVGKNGPDLMSLMAAQNQPSGSPGSTEEFYKSLRTRLVNAKFKDREGTAEYTGPQMYSAILFDVARKTAQDQFFSDQNLAKFPVLVKAAQLAKSNAPWSQIKQALAEAEALHESTTGQALPFGQELIEFTAHPMVLSQINAQLDGLGGSFQIYRQLYSNRREDAILQNMKKFEIAGYAALAQETRNKTQVMSRVPNGGLK